MPKRSSNSGGGKGILALMLLALLGAGVFAAYVKMVPAASRVPADMRRSEPGVSVDVTSIKTKPVESHPSSQDVLLVPAVVEKEVKLGNPVGPVPQGVRPEVFLLNETLASLTIDNARALSIDMKGSVAVVNFNAALQKGYGSIEEGNLIRALQLALGQFKGITHFKVTVEGKSIDTLGNIELSAPIEVIRPGQASQSNSDEESTPSTPS